MLCYNRHLWRKQLRVGISGLASNSIRNLVTFSIFIKNKTAACSILSRASTEVVTSLVLVHTHSSCLFIKPLQLHKSTIKEKLPPCEISNPKQTPPSAQCPSSASPTQPASSPAPQSSPLSANSSPPPSVNTLPPVPQFQTGSLESPTQPARPPTTS